MFAGFLLFAIQIYKIFLRKANRLNISQRFMKCEKDAICSSEPLACVILRGADGAGLGGLVPLHGNTQFGSQPAYVLAGIGGAGQGRVHVDMVLCHDFLERHILVVTLVDYLLLFGRKTRDEVLEVLQRALIGQLLINVRIVERGCIIYLHVDFIVRDELRARVLAMVVGHQVVGNAGNPGIEAVAGRIFALANLENSLHERFLEEVVRQVRILLGHK